MPTPDTRRNNIHLKFEQEYETADVEEALRKAGFQVREIRTVTPIFDGYALTDLLVAGIWNHETGYEYCNGKCQQHQSWGNLTKDQQESFASRYVQFLENCRVEDLEPRLLLADDEDFEDLRLSPHGPFEQ